ncbi:MAG: hypothetical protein WCQ26_13710, partial [Pseudanabaena sp. ELA748]
MSIEVRWLSKISKTFRKKIGMDKYADWAKDLTEEQFIALLCAVGEYGYRAHYVLEILRRNMPSNDLSLFRALGGLEIIAEYSSTND